MQFLSSKVHLFHLQVYNMWIIWIYFFLSTSGALGEQGNKTSDDNKQCDSHLKTLQNEFYKQPSDTFKFLPVYNITYKISRNSSLVFPCIFENLDSYDIVWRKGEKIICDGDNFICERSIWTGKKDTQKYSHSDTTIMCDERAPGRHLNIENLQHEDAGEYFCEVKSPPQIITKMTIKILDTEFISVNQTFSVNQGDTVTLPCEVKDIGEEYDVYWRYWYNPINDNTPIEILNPFNFNRDYKFFVPPEPGLKLEGGYNLQIPNITQEQDGYYACVLGTEPQKLLQHRVIVKN